MGAGVLHAWAWGMEYIEQGAAVRETPEDAIRKAAGKVCRAILRGRDLCPEGRGNRTRMGALRISEGKDGAAPTIHHAVGWPRISSAHTKDSNQSLRLALPNFPLQSSSFRLFSCWQAPTTRPRPRDHPLCSPLLQGAEEERGAEKALTVSQGPRSLDLCVRHITPALFWGKGLNSLS